MNRSGFSIVEIIVVISIVSILGALATVQFTGYLRKNSVENQVRQIYGDVMILRSKALFEKKSGTIKLATTSYSFYSSSVTTVAPLQTKTLKLPITFNNTSDIRYDARGMLDASNKTICITEANSSPVDSIVLSLARIQLGKRDEGATCVAGNVVAK